jgi:surface antigen
MYIRKSIAIVLACALFTSACATDGNGPSNRQTTGAVLGAIAGGLLGAALGGKNRATGAVVGALLGGTLGYGIGSYLDEREREQLALATRKASTGKTGTPITWRATKRVTTTGGTTTDVVTASGWITPVDEVHTTANGDSCRDVQSVATKNGRTFQDKAEICQSSGWVLPTA